MMQFSGSWGFPVLLLLGLGSGCGEKGMPQQPPPGRSTLLRVPSEYATIQAGIDAAADGDTVLVAKGIFAGPGNGVLDLSGKAIVLHSESGADSTIIDCLVGWEDPSGGISVHRAESASTIIEGFTVRNAGAGDGSGTGLKCISASPTIRHCRFVSNPGGALLLDHSLSRLENCSIENTDGQAILIGDSRVEFNNCVIRRNLSRHYGAIFADVSVVVFRECEMTDNWVDRGQGGAIYLLNSRGEFNSCVIARNYADMGGGGICGSGATIMVQQCTIVENAADNTGGGGVLLADLCSAEIDYTVLNGNCAPEGPDLHGSGFSTAILSQTAIDTTRIWGGIRWGWYERLVTGDPGLCHLAGCDSSEPSDYHLRRDSPCARSPRIGALGVACD